MTLVNPTKWTVLRSHCKRCQNNLGFLEDLLDCSLLPLPQLLTQLLYLLAQVLAFTLVSNFTKTVLNKEVIKTIKTFNQNLTFYPTF